MQQVALLTGASRGLGKTIATLLAARGTRMILTARGGAALEETADELSRHGGTIIALAGDVADPDHRRSLAETVQRFGRLDLLVNNASVLGPSPQPSLVNYPPATLRSVFEVNTIAPLALVQSLLPPLRTAAGLIVNISSDAARGGYAGWGGYGASKAALDLLSLTLANELRDQRISVVSVDPGDMRTAMHQAAFPGEDIGDRPLPESTLPFWGWLLGQDPAAVTGRRFEAQGEQWRVPTTGTHASVAITP